MPACYRKFTTEQLPESNGVRPLPDVKPPEISGFTYKIPQVTAASHPFFGRDPAVTSM